MDANRNKISRRDAIKLLGAVAGATMLANLPSKWNTPELVRGSLPAHAQTSGCSQFALTFTLLSATPEAAPVFTLENGIAPIVNTFPGGAGATAQWACNTGCTQFRLFIGFDPNAAVTINVSSFSGVTETYNLNIPVSSIIANLGTGEFSTNSMLNINGCVRLA